MSEYLPAFMGFVTRERNLASARGSLLFANTRRVLDAHIRSFCWHALSWLFYFKKWIAQIEVSRVSAMVYIIWQNDAHYIFLFASSQLTTMVVSNKLPLSTSKDYLKYQFVPVLGVQAAHLIITSVLESGAVSLLVDGIRKLDVYQIILEIRDHIQNKNKLLTGQHFITTLYFLAFM